MQRQIVKGFIIQTIYAKRRQRTITWKEISRCISDSWHEILSGNKHWFWFFWLPQ